MRRDFFHFDGVSSLEYGVVLTGANTERTPQRDVGTTPIPGRNGALVQDNGRWENVEVAYQCAILHCFSGNYQRLIAALASQPGYRKLTDSLRPEEFRLAVFRDGVEPHNTPYNLAGQFELRFDCKPQRYLKSGTLPQLFTAPGTIYNHTPFPAQPRITVTGSGAGTLTVGGYTVEIRELEGSIELDCELMDAYWGEENKNAAIYAPEFPVLAAGSNEIAFDGGITSVEIIPRWWTL